MGSTSYSLQQLISIRNSLNRRPWIPDQDFNTIRSLQRLKPLRGWGTTRKKQVAAGIDLQKSTNSRTVHKPKQLSGALLNACSVCNKTLGLHELIIRKSYVTSFINRAVISRFSAVCCRMPIFATSADRRPILLTLNSFEHWLSGRLTDTAGRPDGDRPNEAANGQFSRALSDGQRWGTCRWPSGLRAISGRCPQIGRLPSDHRRVILRPPAGDRTIIVRFSPPLPQIWVHV